MRQSHRVAAVSAATAIRPAGLVAGVMLAAGISAVPLWPAPLEYDVILTARRVT
jgi:hypothetical protein